MYQSNIKAELQARREDKETQTMHTQFWNLVQVFAVLSIIYATHTMQVFALVVAVSILWGIYKLTRI